MAGKMEGRAETPPKASRGMSLAQNAIAFAVAALIAAGVGGASGFQTAHPGASVVKAQGGGVAKTGDGAKVPPMVEMGSMDLAPVVTNLASPADVWVRLEATMLFEGKTLPHGEALAGEIAGDILAYLRTETLAQIQGVAGLEHLRQDLNDRASIRSEGKVRALIIRSLVVQ
ncbi:flagellar basal body-associated FliL family protein [Rhodoblastus acidophilus]|uniref:Flagellar protein FliL n=1 Tax=Candidatus Rhodoblastus alkanivorans TaxID=2954117 RepID=A0ABS9Z4V3_9HYPH|nr:flagellar basal body-associated FliL family protein [Candidatus Rhodoblastus alkanivorans]MCI4678828.1 flagellar basal body-associated FliL family protein [Candidatus Rhodoblastus alkanivorans]MCI4682217.1 flagellar basal body-associated FliL family protein [Candidatus Rhodoblastus alkanivorans]MDI4639519.1 flagellar basal body-associated FliL family protein [Rhodoblastus acidophilus]